MFLVRIINATVVNNIKKKVQVRGWLYGDFHSELKFSSLEKLGF